VPAVPLKKTREIRAPNRIQLTSDGHRAYLKAVKAAFGDDADYAQLVKIYGAPSQSNEAHRRYSPTPCVGVQKQAEIGNPDPAHISTSYAERQNLNMGLCAKRPMSGAALDARRGHN
jgi:hypothetical protein